MRRRHLIYFLWVLTFMFGMQTAPQAFVLPAEHVLELMTDKMGQASSLYARQTVYFYQLASPDDITETKWTTEQRAETAGTVQPQNNASDAALDVPTVEVVEREETVRYVFSEAFRSEFEGGGAYRLHVHAGGESLTVVDGAVAGKSESRFDLYKDLLLYRSRSALARRLSRLGIDLGVSSLGRFEGQVAFVIGAQYPDEETPQVWIDKESFRPLRWIITGASRYYGRDLCEVRYLDWSKLGPIWYPLRIEFFQDQQMVRVIQVEDYALNLEQPEDLFDLSKLRARYAESTSRGKGRGATENLNEVQKTIEEFQQIIE